MTRRSSTSTQRRTRTLLTSTPISINDPGSSRPCSTAPGWLCRPGRRRIGGAVSGLSPLWARPFPFAAWLLSTGGRRSARLACSCDVLGPHWQDGQCSARLPGRAARCPAAGNHPSIQTALRDSEPRVSHHPRARRVPSRGAEPAPLSRLIRACGQLGLDMRFSTPPPLSLSVRIAHL